MGSRDEGIARHPIPVQGYGLGHLGPQLKLGKGQILLIRADQNDVGVIAQPAIAGVFVKHGDPPVPPGRRIHICNRRIGQVHRAAKKHAALAQDDQGWLILIVEIPKDAGRPVLKAPPWFPHFVPEWLKGTAGQRHRGHPRQYDDDNRDEQPGPQEHRDQLGAVSYVSRAPLLFIYRHTCPHHQQKREEEKEDHIDGQISRGVVDVQHQGHTTNNDRPPNPLPAKDRPGTEIGQNPHQQCQQKEKDVVVGHRPFGKGDKKEGVKACLQLYHRRRRRQTGRSGQHLAGQICRPRKPGHY